MVGGHGRSLDEVRWRLLDELLGVGDGDVHRLDAGHCGPVFFAPDEEIHPGPGLRPAGCRGCGWWRFHPLRLSCACMQCSHSLEVHCDGASGDVQYLAGQAEPRTAGITARCARSGEHAPGDYITENLNDHLNDINSHRSETPSTSLSPWMTSPTPIINDFGF